MSTYNAEFGVTSLLVCLFFGTNFFLFLLFQAIHYFVKPTDELVKSNGQKKLSKPFIGTLECFTNLTSELFRLGLILAFTYVCERHWYLPHSSKSYSRDLFTFVLIVFFGFAYYTIQPVKDLSLLGREQTEEWKGWMQFIFLLYHYFNAGEVYNSVRVMITCYVWMTGFGNFSFFYIKQDFGWLRLAQMFWRLNFAVLLLMWTHGNTYILYYICPMHTFYFLMVYATMYCFSSVNHSKWGIRWKILALGVIIYLIWDTNMGIFDVLFSWLGTDQVIGAKSGSVYEYYFRTSLDHYSTFFGMIFALNYPVAEQFFTKAKGFPLVAAGVLMGGLTLWWLVYCYPLDKLTYNLTHSYLAIIPLTSYIFFRNITPWLRSGVSMGLHELGKTTLETYLLQHHIWLTSNAKTLLTVVPNYPWINFAIVTVIFFVVSKELYRLTMSIRGMIIPDDKVIAFQNLIGLAVLIFCVGIIAIAFDLLKPTLSEIILACLSLAMLSIFGISSVTKNFSDNMAYKVWSKRAIMCLGGLMLVTLLIQLHHSPSLDHKMNKVDTPKCLDVISNGHWNRVICPPTKSLEVEAYCKQFQWVWESTSCPVKKYSNTELSVLLKGKKVAFIGDSQLRLLYHEMNSLIDPTYKQSNSPENKHRDLSNQLVGGISLNFFWAPYISNITDKVIDASTGQWDMVVSGGATWDALHIRNLAQYQVQLKRLSSLDESSLRPLNVWIQPPLVVDHMLESEEKQKFMNENIVALYRKAFDESGLSRAGINAVIDPTKVTGAVGGPGTEKDEFTVDGVHFSTQVYEVMTQMVVNSYAFHFPTAAKTGKTKKYSPKRTGEMSSPVYGFLTLLVAAVMLLLMDSFLGLGYISLTLFGVSIDWDSAYDSLHRKILSPTAAIQQHEIKTTENLDENAKEGNPLLQKSKVEKGALRV